MDFIQLMYCIRKKRNEPLKTQKIKSHDNRINLFTFITVPKGYFPLKRHPPVLS